MASEALGWYTSIFLLLYLTGIGLPPCPEEVGILSAAGLTTLHPDLRWWLAWPAASAGVYCADLTLYAAGRLGGSRLLGQRWVRRVLRTDKLRQIEEKLHRHGMKLLMTARLLLPLRTAVFVTAGAVRYPFIRFLVADSVSVVTVSGAFFFGSQQLIELVRLADHWVLYAALPLAGAYGLYRYWRYRQKKGLRTEPQEAGQA